MIAKPTPRPKVRNCEICGKAIARKARRFCSLRCHGSSMVKVQPLCPVCGVNPVTWKGAKTCSAACGYKQRRDKQGPVPCKGCGTLYRPYPSQVRLGRGYCSRACFYATDGKAKYDEALCVECGVLFVRRPANMHQRKGGRKFCSLVCARTYFRGERSPAWRGGSNPNRGVGWQKRAEEARQRDAYQCRRCGKTQDQNGERLSVDHLIPWRSFDSAAAANHLDNLVALCRGCHAIKTQIAERAWLKGDVLAMARHIEAVTLPSAVKRKGLLA
jgi:predicted nucleic acid-binding Zn ribbon protein